MSKNKKSKSPGSNNSASSKKKVAKKKLSLPAFFSNVKLNCLIIFLLSFLLYGMTLNYSYTQDDAIVITQNDFTKKGTDGIKDILKHDTFHGFFGDSKERVGGGRYRPLTLVMFALGWDTFGNSPAAFHFITVLFYALTGVILYLLLLKMLRPSKGDQYAFFVAMVATVLFIVHPIHTEVVANIKGCDEIVALLGSLAAVYFSLRAFYEKNTLFTVLAGVIFFLALMSKENAITFVVIVPLVYYIFTKANTNETLVQSIPFLISAIAFIAIRTNILGWDLGTTKCDELMNCPYLDASNDYAPYTASQKYGTIFYTLGQYVKLLFFPHPLTHDYYPYAVGPMSFGNWKVLLSLLMYVGLGIYALIGILKKDVVAFGIAFYLLTLSIVSNIVFPVGTNMAERFAFMPSVGFCLAIAVLAYRGWQFFNQKNKSKSAGNLNMILAGVGIVALLFSAKTVLRNPAFKDDLTLFTTDVKISKNSAKVQNSAGGEMIKKAETLNFNDPKRTEMLNEAIGHLNEAIRIHPKYSSPYMLRGNAYQYLSQFDNAIQSYNEAIQRGSKEAPGNMELALVNGANHYINRKEQQKAFQFLQQAEQLRPNDVQIKNLSAKFYMENRNFQKAFENLQKAESLAPNHIETLQLYSRFYGEQNNIEQSFVYLNRAEKIDPQNIETLRLLGIAHGIAQNSSQAIGYLERALKLQPQNASIMFNLGIALQQAGDAQRAQQMINQAKQLDPTIGK